MPDVMERAECRRASLERVMLEPLPWWYRGTDEVKARERAELEAVAPGWCRELCGCADCRAAA